MLFDNYRRIKRISKHLVKGTALLSGPVVIAGVCGVIGLAALIYLKKRADANKRKGYRGYTHVKNSGAKAHFDVKRVKKENAVYTEDDFKVQEPEKEAREASENWIASVTSKTFHKPDCSSVGRISTANRIELCGSRESLMEQGYKPCAACIGK